MIETEDEDDGWISMTLHNFFPQIPFLYCHMILSTRSYFKPPCLKVVKTSTQATYCLELVSSPFVWPPSTQHPPLASAEEGTFGLF